MHQYQRLFNYDDIDKVRVVATFKLRVKSNLFTATLLKLKIYSKGKAYCCFEMDSNNIQFKDVLIDILKVKNPNIKIIDY